MSEVRRPGEEVEFYWALKQLECLGYIESDSSGDQVNLTDRGEERATELLNAIPCQDRLLIRMAVLEFYHLLKGGD